MFGNKKKKNPEQKEKEKTPSNATYSLSALTRGIHHAASSTHAMLGQQYMHLINQFFDEQEDGTLRAKMSYVQLDDQNWIPVPLISLVSPKGLSLEKMEVRLSVKIEEAKTKKATIDADGSDADRLSMGVSLSPVAKESESRNKDLTDITLTFVAGEPPEGLSRIIENYTNLIEPISFNKSQIPKDKYPPTKIGFEKNRKSEEPKDEPKETEE
ncbi:MAG: DUF2589 domain-containing protein [Spirochaetales bacterium]|nr:DUF2589 domain-containing protein [Spirochaetales bacterium]